MKKKNNCNECKHKIWNKETKEWECKFANFPNREECNNNYEAEIR